MLQMMMGGRVYTTEAHKRAMDSNYYPLENMKRSVETLKNAPNIDIATMEYGQYQLILAPAQIAPKGVKYWLKDMGFARIQLNAVPNTQPLSRDQPDVIPLTRLALLDTCMRKCFNSDPPICMQTNVIQKAKDSPDPGMHDVMLEWEYEKGGDVPTLLNFTMVCAYPDPAP